MAAIKSLSIGLLIMLCSVQHSLQDCDRPTNLDPNIMIDPDQQTYGIWVGFVPSCSTGYDKTGPDMYYCSTDYDGSPDYWDPDPSPANLYCSAQGVLCPKPTFTDPAVGFTPEKETYDTHEQVTASCSSGTLQGDDVGVCLSDGTWDFASDPSCLNDCQAPSNSNGTGFYPHASEVTLSCIDGFTLDTGGDNVAAICDNGTWTPPLACELMGCLRPTNLDPNLVIDPDMTSYGLYVLIIISCPSGYEMTGPDRSYCLPDGTWDPNLDTTTCTELCSKPNITDPALVITPEKDSYDPGERVTASCSSGTLQGDNGGVCSSDGTWQFTTEPSCQNDCQAPSNSNGTGSYAHASEVAFSCSQGFSLSIGLDSVAAFCVDGAWSPPIACESTACARPTNLDPNLVIDPDKTSYGYYEPIGISCSPGYEMTGPDYSYCTGGDTWDPNLDISTCTGDCQAQPNSNGTGSYPHTSAVTFSCSQGFSLSTGGDSVAASCDDGAWTPPFTCESTGTTPCTQPTVPTNGSITPDTPTYDPYTRVTYACDDGYTLGGPSEAVCESGAVWNPSTVPTCESNCAKPTLTDGGVSPDQDSFSNGVV